MISFIKSERKRTKSEQSLWQILVLVAVVSLMEVIGGLWDGFPINIPSLIIASYFTGVALLGLMFNWGPVLPCAFIGWFLFLLCGGLGIGSSPVEAVISIYGIPLIGTVLGAIAGLIYDWNLSHPNVISDPGVSEKETSDLTNKSSLENHHEKT